MFCCLTSQVTQHFSKPDILGIIDGMAMIEHSNVYKIIFNIYIYIYIYILAKIFIIDWVQKGASKIEL